MIDLDPKAQALLVSIRDADGPTRREKARVKKRVLARAAGVILAASAGTASTTTAAAVSTAAGVWSAKLVMVAIAASALVAGGAATGVVAFRDHARHRGTATVSQVTAPPPVLAPASEGATQPVATDPRGASTSAPTAHAAVAVLEPPAPSQQTLEEELPLLQSAQEALRLGDTDRALSLLDAHAKRFPAGALAEERRAAHALAACRKPGDPAARAEAQAFLRNSPSSPLVESVRKACSLAKP
jgi:hypothetical protein